MQIIRKCKTCEEINILNKNNIESSQVTLMGGQSIRILYYDCLECGKRNVVQVDNKDTLILLNELKCILLSTRKTFNKKVQKKKYEKKRQSLVDARMALAKEIDGIIATYADGKTETLEVGDLYVEENKNRM